MTKEFGYSPLAQSVEQMTVNHWVAGSSPAGGARLDDCELKENASNVSAFPSSFASA
jgi:hypothetical protein